MMCDWLGDQWGTLNKFYTHQFFFFVVVDQKKRDLKL